VTTATAVDDQEARAYRPSMRDRLVGLPWSWIGPLLVAAFAGVLVFHRLDAPHTIIWDETYYAKDAYSLLHFGVEQNWKDFQQGNPANGYFLSGHPEMGLRYGGAWAAHPPLGKWFIAVGIALFGTDPFAFRFMSAIAGVLSVLILARTARRMTGSTLLGCAAGLLLAMDGIWLVASRVAMLDIFLLMWILAGVGCLVVDRDKTREALAANVEGKGPSGPFVRHGWRIAAAVCFGLACGTKWSGVYPLVFFWALALVWDRNARKAAGVERPWRGMLKLDMLPSLVTVGAVSVAAYVATWWGWLISGTGLQKALYGDDFPGGRIIAGYQRDWADHHPSNIWPTFLNPIRSLWHYHKMTFDFHEGVTNPNPGQSWPWDWPIVKDPALMHHARPVPGQNGCDATWCVSEVLDLGNPAIWWVSIGAMLGLVVMAFFVRDWRIAVAVGGYAACWLPWFPSGFADRTMYSSYALPMLPFAVLAIVLLFDRLRARFREEGRTPGWLSSGGVVYLLVVASALWYFHPILTAETIPGSEYESRLWWHGHHS